MMLDCFGHCHDRAGRERTEVATIMLVVVSAFVALGALVVWCNAVVDGGLIVGHNTGLAGL